MNDRRTTPALARLRPVFGSRLQENVTLANYTTARVGGPAAGMVIANTADELAQAALTLWQEQVDFFLLGSGSNVLVSDRGYHGVVILNHARTVKIDAHHEPPTVWAESGANLGTIARQAALRGFAGLEWAGSVPGSLGGAVYGNAGAHGSDMRANLVLAEILHRDSGRREWGAAEMAYAYRSSALKREPGKAVVLAARLQLQHSTPEAVKTLMEQYSEKRRSSQPPGASMGSMFKNPEGDYAGRLIEAAGLKGARSGAAEISPVHANFFVNHGGATASDIYALIGKARKTVEEKFGIRLELEVELAGDWETGRVKQA